jgi:hypothetical protein
MSKEIVINRLLVPPIGGRIHRLRVQTCLDGDWEQAVNEGGPQTPENYSIRKVGGLYPPTSSGVIDEELILLNYLKGDGGWDKALAWGKQFCLRKTDPRWVFAVGKGYPNFNHKVGLNPTCIVATEDCSFYGIRQSCYIWWEGWWESLQRWAFMRESKYFGGGRDWFAFRN